MTAPEREAVEAVVSRLTAMLARLDKYAADARCEHGHPVAELGEIELVAMHCAVGDRISVGAGDATCDDLSTVLAELERLGRVEQERDEDVRAVAELLDARNAKAAVPSTGWILWTADGRWIGATTSASEDGWRAVSINEAEAQEWRSRGCLLDRMDEAGWRAYNEGDRARWQFDAGSRDMWLKAKAAGQQQSAAALATRDKREA